MREIWKPIVGYEGLYMVSNMGRVKSLNYNRTGKEKLLKPCVNTNGYMRVTLSIGNVAKTCKVHRLVGMAFLPNPDNLPEINHKDLDRTNNCVDNLEWVSSKDNQNYGNKVSRMAKTHRLNGTYDKMSMLYSKPIKCVETDIVYKSITEAEKQTGIYRQNIGRACKNNGTAGGYHWVYELRQKESA